jgi:hypothetical protein
MLAREFWGRHRWGLPAVVALVAAFALVCAIAPLSENVASVNSMWLGMGLCYVIGVFAYGFEGRLESAESGFPARLFVLPVRTWVLVAGPMLQGMAAAVLLWLAWDRLVLRPSGVETPMWWAALLAAVVAVSQALVWVPFGVPWLRLPVAVAVLVVLVRIQLVLTLAGVTFADPDSEGRLLTGFALALIPAAFLAAWAGVARARHGDTSDWSRVIQRLRVPRTAAYRERPPFASAFRSQVWYEWRSRGRGFVIAVAGTVAVILALAALTRWQVGWHLADNAIFLSVPFVIASFWGFHAGESGGSIRSPQLTAFAATRPMGAAAMVGAKFRAAGLASLAAWGLVLAVTLAWASWGDGWDELRRLWERLVAQFGEERAAGFCTAHAVGFVLLTWRMLVVPLWSGLTGRAWVGMAQAGLVMLIVFQGLYEMALWQDENHRERLLDVLRWGAVVLLAAKLAVAGLALWELHRRGELTGRAAAWVMLGWVALVAALFGLLAWVIPSDMIRPGWLAVAVALMVPLARLTVAPLALAWNRHR